MVEREGRSNPPSFFIRSVLYCVLSLGLRVLILRIMWLQSRSEQIQNLSGVVVAGNVFAK